MGEFFVGVMSGTSMDGVDLALVSFENSGAGCLPAVVAVGSYSAEDAWMAFEDDICRELLRSDRSESLAKMSVAQYARLDASLGRVYANCINRFLASERMDARQISAIGLHGQTIAHRPNDSPPMTVQAGDPNVVANTTNITTVADFRRADLACGGQGAPLLPVFHKFVFAEASKNIAVLNLGGIANLSLLHADSSIDGFDAGPANCALDAWIRRCLHAPFDEGGSWAASADYDRHLVNVLLNHDYFGLPIPKSTCIGCFGLPWVQQAVAAVSHDLSNNQVQASILEAVSRSIIYAVTKYMPDLQSMLVCGGGVNNRVLLSRLRELLGGVEVQSVVFQGMHPQYVEAAAFAWFARERLAFRPLSIGYTGSKPAGGVVSGGVYQSSVV